MNLFLSIMGYLLLAVLFRPSAVIAASGMFPKMPAASEAFVVHCGSDSEDGRFTGLCLQGLVNQQSAEVYLIPNRDYAWEQLRNSEKRFSKLPRVEGADAGLRTLFRKYGKNVERIFVYDPAKDWSRYLALMAGAQQKGLPATDSVTKALISEFGWKGEVIDFRERWTNRIDAYNWALTNLMPGCSKKVVFALKRDMPLLDYAVATKGFTFWLNLNNQEEREQASRIFQCKGYGVGTSLMGYASTGDQANRIANKFGIGYVVSDLYANASFWSSFPNKTYIQEPGTAAKAEAGKIYVAITWSDGDNLQFDQNALYVMWKDPARGSIPVGTTLSPGLQEIDTPLLDWYYGKATRNDELMAGPCGVQFIYGNDFNESLFPSWCVLNKEWLAGSGFRSTSFWAAYPSKRFTLYLKTCGSDGVFPAGSSIGGKVDSASGMPLVEGVLAGKEDDVFERMAKLTPNSKIPIFMSLGCVVEGFCQDKDEGGYTKLKRQVDRLEKAFPNRFVFVLPKELFATMRAYYKLPTSK